MEKINTYMINKIFTVPYIDKLVDENSVPDSFIKCIQRYVKNDNLTYGKATRMVGSVLRKFYGKYLN